MTLYKNKNNKECIGCFILVKCDRQPFHKKINDKDITYCPCIECIIKMICNYPCPEFKRYTSSYYKYLSEDEIEITKTKVTKNEENR